MTTHDHTETDRAPRLLVAGLALAIGLALAGLALAPHHKPTPKPSSSSTDPRWDRCWTEQNPAMPDGTELICGSVEAYNAYTERTNR